MTPAVTTALPGPFTGVWENLRHRMVVPAVLAFVAFPLATLAGQDVISVRVQTPGGYLDPGLSVEDHRGFASVPAQELTRLGWTVVPTEQGLVALWRGGSPVVELQAGSPFLSWGGDGVQLAEAPYRLSDRTFIPLQVFIDILPWKLPEVFQYDPDEQTLVVREENGIRGSLERQVRVVVIDPGHGGRDTGARGRGGTQEKDVALAIGRALARELREDENLQVFLTREGDSLIPLWKRGELDWNVPLNQSEQLYQSLRRLGRDTMLVIYPGQSHGIRKPTYQKDRYERYLEWYGKYLGDQRRVTSSQ